MDENNICDYCKGEYEPSQLVSYRDNGERVSMCPSCRKKYCVETADDIHGELVRNIVSPIDFVKMLDRKVKGQYRAKKSLAIAVHSHYTRVCNTKYLDKHDKPFEKSNIIMTGPSGTGKTLLAKTMAEILDVPFVIVNSTTLSETGYVGQDVESILSRLLKAAKMNVNKAECGIVFIDEIDKKAMKGENTSITRDVSGEGVQSALLTMIEGCKIGVSKNEGRIHPQEKLIEMDTSNILFICGGAFSGIEDIVKKRLNIAKSGKSTIGFGGQDNIDISENDLNRTLRKKINHRDLEKYGMIREFLGRLPIICNLEPLTKKDMMEILFSQYGIIEEYKTYFELQNKTITFSDEALDLLADGAIDKNLGARGLRGLISGALEDMLYNAPSEDKTDYVVEKEDLEEAVYEYYIEYTNALMTIEKLEAEFKENNSKFSFGETFKRYVAKEAYEQGLDSREMKSIIYSMKNEGIFNDVDNVSSIFFSEYLKTRKLIDKIA